MIYLDSCLLIYAFEDQGTNGQRTREQMAKHPDEVFAISPLGKLECLVKPLRDSNFALTERYRSGLARFRQLAMTEEVFLRAAELRAHQSLKTPDALHLAAAQIHGCDALWTNDQRLQSASNGFTVGILQAE